MAQSLSMVTLSSKDESSVEPVPENNEHAQLLEQLGLRFGDDGYVKWRFDCEAHPRNWTLSRKAFDTTLILMLDLFTYVSFLNNQ